MLLAGGLGNAGRIAAVGILGGTSLGQGTGGGDGPRADHAAAKQKIAFLDVHGISPAF